MKLLFSSSPLQEYFSADTHLIPGKNTSDIDPLAHHHWQQSLMLPEGKSYAYTIHSINNPSLLYDFAIQSLQPLSSSDETILVCTVKKNIQPLQPGIAGEMPPDSKKEYAEFIDLAVHDLEAPVRKLTVMFDKIAEAMENDAPGNVYLARAQRILSEMKTQIESLGVLSGLEHQAVHPRPSDLDRLVRSVAEGYGESVDFNIGRLPVVHADPDLLTSLIGHLIQNSVKFGKRDIRPVIHITADETEENELNQKPATRYHRIVIDDNGIGFPAAMTERIFRPFVRLNGKSEYPGPGMGLAIARKIAGLLNGRLTAEPADNGARFILILPQTTG